MAKDLYKSLKERIQKIKDAGYKSPTEKVLIRELYGNILYNYGTKNYGEIMPYRKVKESMEKQGLKPYTLDEYNKMLRSLDNYADISIKGVKREYIQKAVATLESAQEYFGDDEDSYIIESFTKNVNVNDIREVYRRAEELENAYYHALKLNARNVNKNYTSYKSFYEFLSEAIKEYQGR